MTINTLAQYQAALKQRVIWMRNNIGLSAPVAECYFNAVALATGQPLAGTLAGSNVTTGAIPVASSPGGGVSGYPAIMPFSGVGYLSRLEFSNCNNIFKAIVFDQLWVAGTFSFGADTVATLTSLDFSGRVPNNPNTGTPDYTGLQIWIEITTTWAGTPSFTIDYKDENGTAQQATWTSTGANPIAGDTYRLAMASAGVKQITRVRESSGSTVGAFNVVVNRSLGRGQIGHNLVSTASGGMAYPQLDFLGTGMPQVYSTSALAVYVYTNSFQGRDQELYMEIASG